MIVAVGVCKNGWVVRDGYWLNPSTNRKEYGITSPTPCEKCDGKGCPKPSTSETDPTAS